MNNETTFFTPLQKNEAYYRSVARSALKPFFGIAIVAVLIASLLGGATSVTSGLSFDIEELETFAPPSTARSIPLETPTYTPLEPMGPEELRELFDRVSALEAKVAQLEARPQASAPIVDTSKGPNDWPEWKKTLIETINSL